MVNEKINGKIHIKYVTLKYKIKYQTIKERENIKIENRSYNKVIIKFHL